MSSVHFRIGLCFFILSGMSCLYILDINLWSISLFANIFSHSGYCLFISLVVSFAVQEIFSLRSPICLLLLLFFLHLWLFLTLKPLLTPYPLLIDPALLLPSSWTQLLLSPHEPESSKQYLSFTIFLDTFSTFIFLENSYSSFEMLLRCHFFHKASLDHSGQGKHSSVSWAYLYFLHRSYWIITVFYNLSSLRVKTVSYCIFLFSWNND